MDRNTEYLVFGFIRSIGIKDQIIPSSIIKLCIEFYFYNITIIYMELSTTTDHPEMCMILDQQKCNNFEIKSLYDSINYNGNKNCPLKKGELYNSGICFAKSINLNKNILSNQNKLIYNSYYDVIFAVCSGSKDQCISYIINGKNMYYLQLPSISNKDMLGTSTIYSSKYGLICVGGRSDKNLNILNVHDNNDCNWILNSMEQKRRRHLSVSMINDDKLICCGGFSDETFSKWHTDTNLYDFEKKQWTKSCDMKCDRYKHGIYFDKFTNNRVFIGGGTVLAAAKGKDCAYYDIIKNEWFDVCKTNKNHSLRSIMWMNDINIIYITSTSAQQIEQIDLRINECISVKSNTYNNNNVFYQLFNNDINNYDSRFIL